MRKGRRSDVLHRGAIPVRREPACLGDRGGRIVGSSQVKRNARPAAAVDPKHTHGRSAVHQCFWIHISLHMRPLNQRPDDGRVAVVVPIASYRPPLSVSKMSPRRRENAGESRERQLTLGDD